MTRSRRPLASARQERKRTARKVEGSLTAIVGMCTESELETEVDKIDGIETKKSRCEGAAALLSEWEEDCVLTFQRKTQRGETRGA